MATSIPPHNLGELVDAVKAYMKNQDLTSRELMRYVKGPDFPTGGIVINQDELAEIYEKGQGRIRLRGKVEIEEEKGGRKRLVISQIPYTWVGSGIGKFLNDVAALVEGRKTADILDISNQSSKAGIRIVLELRKGADAENLINMLYKKTRLEDTFSVNMLAVAEGRPETLSLKQIIEHHVDFQFEITTRKYRTLLAKEQEKREVQEGLIKACNVIDLIIEILRGSPDVQRAKACLVEGVTEGIRFKGKISEKMAAMLRFTPRQAQAILDMRLYRLIGLEIQALEREHEETLQAIARYEDILNNYDSMVSLLVGELDALKKAFGQARRTRIENGREAVFEEGGMEEQEVVILLDRFGYGRVIDRATFERNKEAALEESRFVVPCKNTGVLGLFTSLGRMHLLRMRDLPLGKFRDKGTPIDNISNFDSDREEVLCLQDLEGLPGERLLFITGQGMIKQVEGSEFFVSKRTIGATKLVEGDALVGVLPLAGEDQVVLQTRGGFFLRFPLTEVPEKKKGAIGVRGIRLAGEDRVEAAYLLTEGEERKIPFGQRQLTLNRLKLARRDGKGTKSRT